MEEARLDDELERIYKRFSFLWGSYDFQLRYFTRDYGMYYKGFIIGIGNSICKLVFEKESNSKLESIAINVGKSYSSFTPPNYSYYTKYGWYPLTGLIYWLTGVECERDKAVDQDLEYVSDYLKLNIDKLLDLFKNPNQFDEKIEYHRNLYKDNQITVDKIRRERARLHALGQNSSLEAAIANLRGGKK
jgi:hypothetical protein